MRSIWRKVSESKVCDENDFAAKRARAGGAANGNGVRVLETGQPANELDVVQLQILKDAGALHVHDFALVVHEILDGEIFLKRVIDAVETALLKPGKIERGLAQRLAGDGTGVDAAAAWVVGAFDDGNALAEIGGLRAGLFSSGTATDDDQIERLNGRHRSLPRHTHRNGRNRTGRL
jgi:hypothetical protein